MQHVHILGICGTFMGGLALLARELGFRVTGSDENVYPPMSDQLQAEGIELIEGYANDLLEDDPDVVIVGNALSRGNPVIERLLNRSLYYVSGPEWLSQQLLWQRWVIAVAGTHGKTTTASMVAWMLSEAGFDPGYLIGGVPQQLGRSARLGRSPFFVIEADEYDSAFFDKRSKFVWYRPRTLVLNNLEFDHADIFSNLGEIERQFHHLIRTVPQNGQLILPNSEPALQRVLAQGCWSPRCTFALPSEPMAQADWQVHLDRADGTAFSVSPVEASAQASTLKTNPLNVASVTWPLTGAHNVSNGAAALLAAHHAGLTMEMAAELLTRFPGVKRRMEVILTLDNGLMLYEDFAHHPTAIQTTLAGLKQQLQRNDHPGRILAIIEPRSNTMKAGVHRAQLVTATASADAAFWLQPVGLTWDLAETLSAHEGAQVFTSVADIIDACCLWAGENDQIVIMSNGGFEGIYQRLSDQLTQKFTLRKVSV